MPRRNHDPHRGAHLWQRREALHEDLPQPTTGQLAHDLVLRGLASPGILEHPLSPADLEHLAQRQSSSAEREVR